MSEPYPLPAYAASIWAVGDQLCVCFTGPTGASHTVKIPTTEAGMLALASILRQRASAGVSTIATKGEPTQWQVSEEVLKHFEAEVRKRKAKTKRMSAAERLLKELDLD